MTIALANGVETQTLLDALKNPLWRIENLYWIIDDHGDPVRFKLREVQRDYLAGMWSRNLCPKSRQHGFSTLLLLIGLDECLFVPNTTGATVADKKESAEKLFRTKLKYPWTRMPEQIKERIGLEKETSEELIWGNGSSYAVTTSARSGTLQILHVSEFGKICAKYPEKANEIISGSIPAVVQTGKIHIESTAEGQEGHFYNMVMAAKQRQDQRSPETILDFRLHFFPWWKKPLNVLDPQNVILSQKAIKYFDELKNKHGIVTSPSQQAWYVKTQETLGDLMWREHPSYCIAEGEPIFTAEGIVPIELAKIDGSTVLNVMSQGVKPTYRLKTYCGYEVVATAEHRIKTPDGWAELSQLSPGRSVLISHPANSSGSPQSVRWNWMPSMTTTVDVTEDFAEFVGIFMGDGSLCNDMLSVVCTREDRDVVARVCELAKQLFGLDLNERNQSEGAAELRAGSVWLRKMFDELGLLRRSTGKVMRLVHVPDFIKKSPDAVVCRFLRGLFEADGHAMRNGTGVKFFSKYDDFARDVQMLLLRVGITSRRIRKVKIAGNGSEYTGNEISLRMKESILFAEKIGFISARKQGRALSRRQSASSEVRRHETVTQDEIVSIEPAGDRKTFDITTPSHEFVAGGIVVHNCEEAFAASVEGAILQEQMRQIRDMGRIGRFPYDPRFPVNTFWDFGLTRTSGQTVILYHQRINVLNRLIGCDFGTDIGIGQWVNVLRSKPYTYAKHYMPHDANTKGQGMVVRSRVDLFNDKDVYNIEVVPRIDNLWSGVEMLRSFLLTCEIDEAGCADLIKALDSYRREWDEKAGKWKDRPLHNWASDFCDSMRQAAQGYTPMIEHYTHQHAQHNVVRDVILEPEVGY